MLEAVLELEQPAYLVRLIGLEGALRSIGPHRTYAAAAAAAAAGLVASSG